MSKLLVLIPTLALTYYTLGKVGLLMAIPPGLATPLWLPAGIALTAVLFLGKRLLLGVALGSFLVNLDLQLAGDGRLGLFGASALAACIALGACAQAYIGARLTSRWLLDRSPLESRREILRFCVVPVALGCAVSPTVGLTAASASEAAPWAQFGVQWVTWWLGDSIGVLMVAPVFLAWRRRAAFDFRHRGLELALCFALTTWGSYLVFSAPLGSPLNDRVVSLALLAFLFWAAWRLGSIETLAVMFVIAGLSIWGTTRGTGPFVGSEAVPALLMLEIFLVVLITTALGAVATTNERHRTEKTVVETEDRYRSLVEMSPAGIAILRDKRFVYANPAMVALLGATRAEAIVGRTVGEFLSESDQAVSERRMREISETGRHQPPHHYRVLRLDGRIVDVESRGGPCLHQGQPAIQLVAQDVSERLRMETERERVEEALRRSEEKYRLLVETSNDLIWSVDAGGRWTFLNREAARRIYGYEVEEMLGRPFTDFLSPQQAQADLQVFERIKGGQSYFRYETIHLRKDGSPVHLSFNAMEVRDAEGKVCGTAGTASDITEHKRLEEGLRQSQKMEAIGRLAGGIAHDFNNLLTIINGYGELLSLNLQLPEALRAPVTQIREAGQRAANLTRQLLALSRRQVLRPILLDLNSVVRDAEKLLERLIGEDIQLVTSLEPALWPVRVDRGQIDQVIINLAANSRDALNHDATSRQATTGGGMLRLETRNVEIAAGSEGQPTEPAPGSYVLLAVTDNGCGMDASTLSHLFEPFFTTKELGKGTGLGLATIYGIVKQSGGHVQGRSQVGQGSTFSIYLPRADLDPPASEADSKQTPAASPRGFETVLLVEDEEAVRRLTRQVLELNGYKVLEARDGVDALEVFSRHLGTIQLLVTDVVMPRMCGRQLAEKVAVLDSRIKVLFVSGYTDDALKQHGIGESGVSFLQKPFSAASLATKVRDVLRGTRQESIQDLGPTTPS